MILVPHAAKFALVGLVVGGSFAPALAGGILPGNGGAPINLGALPSLPAEDVLTSSNSYAGGDALEQRFGVHNGALDFFSLRSDDSGNFKPLLSGGVGDGGLHLQVKW
jgi:hypothetical protein